jgi:hypothetical protein
MNSKTVFELIILWDLTPRNPFKINEHFGEKVTSIFRIDEQLKQETKMEQAASRAGFNCAYRRQQLLLEPNLIVSITLNNRGMS